jgi:hypothetical protein
MNRTLAGSMVVLCAAAQVRGPSLMPSERLLRRPNAAPFSRIYRTAVDAYFSAQLAYQHQDYTAAAEILETLWRLYPPGGRQWITALGEADNTARRDGIYFGSPPCYYALRMLTECVTWRLKSNTSAAPGRPIRLGVVLVGHSSGIEPTTRQELAEQGGRQVRHTLRPELTANGSPALQEASWLFREYVQAITGGRMPVDLAMVNLPDLDLAMRVVTNARTQPSLSAELEPGGLDRIWRALSPEVRSRVDWWWVLYPSHRPEDYPELEGVDFSNGGGTTVGPDGKSFATFGDDLGLVRKPPGFGKSPYLPEERMTYWAQILQHEFFHHLFSIYPKLQLEAKDHQWFDRESWPADFDGAFEADYYAEAVHKRLQAADPPMWVKLRYTVPPEVLAKIAPAMLLGTYRRTPAETHWHEGRIVADKSGLVWVNQAGTSWRLEPESDRLILGTGGDNPYAKFGLEGSRAFRIVLGRGASGEYLAEIAGFEFLGDLYEKVR